MKRFRNGCYKINFPDESLKFSVGRMAIRTGYAHNSWTVKLLSDDYGLWGAILTMMFPPRSPQRTSFNIFSLTAGKLHVWTVSG